MSLPLDALADPTGSVIREFQITDEREIALVRQWGEMIAARERKTYVVPAVRTGQTTPHPLAVELLKVFGTRTYKMRDALDRNHKASWDAQQIRQAMA